MTDTDFERSLDMIRQETASNHAVFTSLRETFTHHEGEYALMRSRQIIDFYADRRSALAAGQNRFTDGLFSVHRVLPHERRRGGGTAPPEDRRRIGL